MLEIDTLQKSLLDQYGKTFVEYQSLALEVEHQVKCLLQVSKIEYNAVTSRLKSRNSVAEKVLRKQGKYARISDITDIAGVRIITYYSADVDKVAEIIEKEFDIDYANSIDKRKSLEPDRFGYCSVHYVVKMSAARLSLREFRRYKNMKCEIQIRSILQHAWAEIEHDIGYKNEITIPMSMRRNFSRIAGLLEIADEEFDQIRKNLAKYKEEMQTEYSKKDFGGKILDRVILDTIIHINPDINAINQHIVDLFGGYIDYNNSDETYKMTIQRLSWFGVKTVADLNDAILKYAKGAKKIATELLRASDHEKDSRDKISSTVAFFYLCYSMLLMNNSNLEDIKQYIRYAQIGLPEKVDQTAQELYELKENIK